jgi:hypothetical protein
MTNSQAIQFARAQGIPFAGALSARLGGLVYRLTSRADVRRARAPRAAAACERRMPWISRAFLAALEHDRSRQDIPMTHDH